ncbi:universal stress protein [Natronobeatus ordinarius]|uniref:universal stress protein n=1 Tax=Natronobeatus ordinarius TaxID=2963433 RepID=UPI0020CF88F9|nr:universal stress protein [Natronobeatus ordinarius]
MADPNRVLVPALGRSCETESLEYVLETFPNAEVTVLSVITPLDARLSEGKLLERSDERLECARADAKAIVDAIDADPDHVRVVTAEGRPGTVIPRYASEGGFDHVVMCGTDAHPIVRRLLGRDLSTTVINRTPVPVTVLEGDSRSSRGRHDDERS